MTKAEVAKSRAKAKKIVRKRRPSLIGAIRRDNAKNFLAALQDEYGDALLFKFAEPLGITRKQFGEWFDNGIQRLSDKHIEFLSAIGVNKSRRIFEVDFRLPKGWLKNRPPTPDAVLEVGGDSVIVEDDPAIRMKLLEYQKALRTVKNAEVAAR